MRAVRTSDIRQQRPGVIEGLRQTCGESPRCRSDGNEATWTRRLGIVRVCLAAGRTSHLPRARHDAPAPSKGARRDVCPGPRKRRLPGAADFCGPDAVAAPAASGAGKGAHLPPLAQREVGQQDRQQRDHRDHHDHDRGGQRDRSEQAVQSAKTFAVHRLH